VEATEVAFAMKIDGERKHRHNDLGFEKISIERETRFFYRLKKKKKEGGSDSRDGHFFIGNGRQCEKQRGWYHN
jgi:hypothetical protein